MYNNLSEVILRLKKLVPDPEEVFLTLEDERNARPDAGMNKIIVAANK